MHQPDGSVVEKNTTTEYLTKRQLVPGMAHQYSVYNSENQEVVRLCMSSDCFLHAMSFPIESGMKLE